VAAALRYLDAYGGEPDAPVVAEALARFLVARCESHHAGWRALRRVVVDSAADAPWEKCARRAVSYVADDLLLLSEEGGRTPLSRAQHVAALHRAEEIAPYVDPAAVLAGLGLPAEPVDSERWTAALGAAIGAKSRDQVARAVAESLAGEPDAPDPLTP
jgi:AcrR family transcriptional regulator